MEDNKVISCCGVICSECEYYPKDCSGCPSIGGKPFWLQYTGEGVCPIYNCCITDKKKTSCANCEKLPCAFYERGDTTKSDEENKAILEKQLEVLRTLKNNH